MTKQAESTPATVPQAQQAGMTDAERELWLRWRWVEPSDWTIRMLAALEQGVKGDRWFRLYDKVYSERNLRAGFQQVASKDGAAGVDHVTIRQFERQIPESIWDLSDRLKDKTFHPQAIRRVRIPKLGTNETRPLGIPTIRDRVVQAAIVNVIEPIFEQDFAEHSYGFRPGRGCKDALRRVEQLIQSGHHYVLDADLKSYFDTIPHEPLMNCLRTKIADGSVLSLIESFLKANIMEEAKQWTPEEGAPQGAVLSPLLSNIYLNPLDHLMASSGMEMVRYADDFVILCRTAEDAARAREIVREWTASNGLALHPTKTKIVDVHQSGFDFLGYHFERTTRWPRTKSIQKLKDTLRAKTKRTSGHSLQHMVKQVNLTLCGWFAYFKHSHYTAFRRIDSWIRGRLRSTLRKRAGRRGRGRGADHQRWPNVFFAEHGLFSLVTAHAMAVQSSQR